MTDIMTSLYDQERATREYGEEQKEEGIKEGLQRVAMKMIMQGFTDEQIRSVIDYGEKDIMSLRHD